MFLTRVVPDVPLALDFGESLTAPLPERLAAVLFPQGMHCYAVLDGAACPNIPDMLTTSGLAHDCLFQGDARKDLGDVAPWIVELSNGHALTRQILTAGDAPWLLWDRLPIFLLHSNLDLRAVRTHLRKFTRLEGDEEKYFYFRFWEAAYLEAFIAGRPKEEVAAILHPDHIGCVYLGREDGLRVYESPEVTDVQPLPRLRLTDDLRLLFGRVAMREFDRGLMKLHCEEGDMDRQFFADCLNKARQSGFRSRVVLRDYLSWCASCGDNVLAEDWAHRELQSTSKYSETLRYGRLRVVAHERNLDAAG